MSKKNSKRGRGRRPVRAYPHMITRNAQRKIRLTCAVRSF